MAREWRKREKNLLARAISMAICVRNVAFGDFAADDGAGNDFAAIDHRGNNHDVEPIFLTEIGEQAHVAGLLMAEPEIFADENGFTMQIADENLLDKFAGGEPRELESEWQNHDGFESERVEPLHALRVGREPQRGRVRVEH